MVERGQVPPAGVDDQAVRAELALALLARERAVAGAQTPAPADRLRQAERRVASHRSGAGRSLGEGERRLERLDAAA